MGLRFKVFGLIRGRPEQGAKAMCESYIVSCNWREGARKTFDTEKLNLGCAIARMEITADLRKAAQD